MDKKEIISKVIENHCPEIEKMLSDENILPECLKSASLMKKFSKISNEFKKAGRDDKDITQIMMTILPYLIAPGSKGNIRGKKFENIILQHIKEICCKYGFTYAREKKHSKYITDEIPDFYIECGEKVILIFAQISLWGGGQQTNRGYKYIFHSKCDNITCKKLSVIVSKPNIKSETSKVYKLFEKGFIDETLCYVTNLEDIICKFFDKYYS